MPEVLLLDVEFYADERRDFLEPYNLKSWQALGLRKHFVQDYQSCSKTGVLRNLHCQLPQPQGYGIVGGCSFSPLGFDPVQN